MADRRQEKIGWLGGWAGGFIWVVILAVMLLVQGKALEFSKLVQLATMRTHLN